MTLKMRKTPPPAPPRARGGEPKRQARAGWGSLVRGNLPDMILLITHGKDAARY